MNTPTKEASFVPASTDNEQTEKYINTMPDSTSYDQQFIQQLCDLARKNSVELVDETTQTSNFTEAVASSLRENSSLDNDSSNQEQDIYYQTVLDIFLFFKRRFTIPYILNTIHQCAGNIPIALQKLNHSTPKAEEPCNFSYHKITGTKDQIDAYFDF